MSRATPQVVARAALVALAVALRLWQVAAEPAYLHPDALFQGLEPAFRAVHGFGGVAWEFKQGLRSWTWPGLLAAPFALCHWAGLSGPGVGMALAVGLARTLVVLIDLFALREAALLARREGGPVAAAGLLLVGASHPMFVVMAAQPLVDVPAAALLLALARRGLPRGEGPPPVTLRETPSSPLIAPTFHGETPAPPLVLPVAVLEPDAEAAPSAPTAAALVGALAALTALVRVQLAPAVVVAVWFAARSAPRARRRAWVRSLALGGLAVVGAWAAVDALTWGAPLHSLTAYLGYNLQAGQTAFGVMPVDRYWVHFGEAAPGLRWLALALALAGAWRAPALAAVALAVLVPHQLVPYKVWRFVHPALWLVAVLAAIGAVQIAQVATDRVVRARRARGVGTRPRRRTVRAGYGALALAAALWSAYGWLDAGLWRTTWLYHQGGDEAVARSRGINAAYLAAGETRAVRKLVQGVLPEAAAPGLALLGHPARVLHPVGARVSRGALAGADAWVVVDGPDRVLFPRAPRAFRDHRSGVALVLLRPAAAAQPGDPPGTPRPSPVAPPGGGGSPPADPGARQASPTNPP